MDAGEIATLLGLEPLEGEGGRFARTYADEAGAAIYYLLAAGERSAPHRLEVTEVWHHYAGAPAWMLLLHPDGRVDEPVLGDDLAGGARPQLVVPAGTWMAAEARDGWALMGCTTAPPYTPAAFTLGDVEALAAGWPEAAARIRRLTRGSAGE